MRIGRLGDVDSGERESATSFAARSRQTSRMLFVSTTHVNPLLYFPPLRSPLGPRRNWSIIKPAFRSEMLYVAARLARTWGLTLAMNILPFCNVSEWPLLSPFDTLDGDVGMERGGYESRTLRTSACDCRDTRTASAEVTHPEHARQSVNDICAGAGFAARSLSSVVTS